MRRLTCLLCVLSLGCDKDPKPTPAPVKEPTKKDVPKKAEAPTTPLPAANPDKTGRAKVTLGEGVGLVLDAPLFADDPERPPMPTLYLTRGGGVVETLQDTAALFPLGKEPMCEELDVDASVVELGGGAKAARLSLGCRIGEDARTTTEHVALLGLPQSGAITKLAALGPRWMGLGGRVESMMMAECVTTLKASYKLEGKQLVITRKATAEYTPPEGEPPTMEAKDCQAPKESVDRAPWAKAP